MLLQFQACLRIHCCVISATSFAFAAMSPMAGAAELRAARVTKIINDVKLLPGQAAARAAAVNDELGSGTAVHTGVDSRTELTFADLTITRLGANTIFSFSEGARTIELGGGAVLVQVPRGGAGSPRGERSVNNLTRNTFKYQKWGRPGPCAMGGTPGAPARTTASGRPGAL